MSKILVIPKLLIDVPRPEGNTFYGHNFAHKSLIRKHVEYPMIQATEYLYDLGIQTSGSGTCALEVSNGYAFLFIIYNSLCDENKKIANDVTIIRDDPYEKYAEIRIDVHDKTTVKYIQHITHVIVRHFKPQRAYWARFTLDELKNKYEIKTDYPIEQFIEDFNLFYDSSRREYWLSEELYNINRLVRVIRR